MAKIIKSNRVNLSESSSKEKDKFFDVKNKTQQEGGYSKGLIKKAEDAAFYLVDKAENIADKLINEARENAKTIEKESLLNAGSIYDSYKVEAKTEGYNEGYEEGQREAAILLAKAKLEYEEALLIKSEWKKRRENILQDAEEDAIKLVLAIAKKVISREIEDVSYVEALIAEGMRHLNYASDIILRVSEKDFDAASLAKPKILAMAERIENLEIRVDYSLQQGGCVIDTATGIIDASAKTQIAKIEKIFTELLSIDKNVAIRKSVES